MIKMTQHLPEMLIALEFGFKGCEACKSLEMVKYDFLKIYGDGKQ